MTHFMCAPIRERAIYIAPFTRPAGVYQSCCPQKGLSSVLPNAELNRVGPTADPQTATTVCLYLRRTLRAFNSFIFRDLINIIKTRVLYSSNRGCFRLSDYRNSFARAAQPNLHFNMVQLQTVTQCTCVRVLLC